MASPARIKVALGLALLVMVGAAALALQGADRREITKRLESLTHAATRQTPESGPLLLAGLMPQVTVAQGNDAEEERPREELVSAWLAAGQLHGPLYVELRELDFSIEAARARVAGEALVSQSQHDDIHARVQPFVVHLEKPDSEWRVRAIRLESGAPALPEARP